MPRSRAFATRPARSAAARQVVTPPHVHPPGCPTHGSTINALSCFLALTMCSTSGTIPGSHAPQQMWVLCRKSLLVLVGSPRACFVHPGPEHHSTSPLPLALLDRSIRRLIRLRARGAPQLDHRIETAGEQRGTVGSDGHRGDRLGVRARLRFRLGGRKIGK